MVECLIENNFLHPLHKDSDLKVSVFPFNSYDLAAKPAFCPPVPSGCRFPRLRSVAGPQSAEILARLLTDADSFTIAEDRRIAELQTKLEAMSAVLQPVEWEQLENQLLPLLSKDTRFSLAVACLKASLAQQRKALGSN